jgi:hypothetical protein
MLPWHDVYRVAVELFGSGVVPSIALQGEVLVPLHNDWKVKGEFDEELVDKFADGHLGLSR